MLSSQAQKAMHCVLRLRKHFGDIEMKDMFSIFDATVKPILCYGSQIWGYMYVHRVEKVHAVL